MIWLTLLIMQGEKNSPYYTTAKTLDVLIKDGTSSIGGKHHTMVLILTPPDLKPMHSNCYCRSTDGVTTDEICHEGLLSHEVTSLRGVQKPSIHSAQWVYLAQ